MPKTLYLLDGHALAYRTYFALTGAGGNVSRWKTSDGEPTAGTYGFVSVLMRYLEQDRPDYLAVAFDVGRTFRDDLFDDYKGTREKMPDDLRVQIERIREIVDAFNIPRLEMENYEADDVLGSIARKVAAQGLGVKIITGDRDLLQLVDDRIIVTLPDGRSLSDAKDYTAADVVEKMGVRPDQIVDYKALVGDSSDNIPGVRGVGKKTAEALLSEYPTLDAVYENLDVLRKSWRNKLEAGRESAYLSQKLAQIVTDLDIDIDLDAARIENFQLEPVLELFHILEFRTLTKRLYGIAESFGKEVIGAAPATTTQSGAQLALFTMPTKAGETPADTGIETVIVDTPDALAAMVAELNQAHLISFDTETTSTDKMQAELVGISLAVEPTRGFYIPVGHNTGTQLPRETVLNALRPALTAPNIGKIAHNAKYDYVMLARYGIHVAPLTFDTMIAEWLRDPNSRNLGLKRLAWVRLGIEMTEITALIGKGKKQITMAQVAISDAAPYAVADAALALQLMPLLQNDLEEVNAVALFETIEMPLISVLAAMEMEGIDLDLEFLADMQKDLHSEITALETKVHEAVGMAFNLNSTQQLSQALFETLKLSPPDRTRKTSSGYYSTSASVLEAMRDQHPVIDWMLQYRELSKLQSTYVEALPAQVNPATGRVHTSYNQTGSVTGRLASSNPNLQNIPIRTELGRLVRKGFKAAPGASLLAVDYSQVELRLAAHMSSDQAMINAFRAGQDIHATTAAAVYGMPLEQVEKNQRRHAKAINFGLIYGMSAFGLTRTTELTLAESEDFVEAYFEKFPGVKAYLDNMRKLAANQGYVETLLGRRRYFPNLARGGNQNIRRREEREAINAPIQGTAADIMKIAMIQLADALSASDLDAKILLQVHDELVLECPTEQLVETARLVQQVMENAYALDVPLGTDARAGTNWYELAPIPGL